MKLFYTAEFYTYLEKNQSGKFSFEKYCEQRYKNYTPEMAYEWLRLNRTNKFERDYLERIIATDVEYSYLYARVVLGKPFPLGEKAITTSAECSYLYAVDVLEKPFILGEKTIATNAKYSYWYARDVLGKPFPLGEPIIATDAEYSYYYVLYVLKKAFQLGEETIFSRNYHAKNYIDFLIETNQMNESTMFDNNNATRILIGKFLDGKI